MDCAPTRVELDGGGSQKTSAGKGRLADVVDPAVADREQPRAPGGLNGCGLVHGGSEHVDREVERGQL